MSGKEGPAEQIVLVRRRGSGEDDQHHGGVWKIAYADFMTAMMAFFLVMWLINASNTETKASIASYFNPIKLTDNVARKKGLLDIDEKANASDRPKRRSDEAAAGKKQKDLIEGSKHRGAGGPQQKTDPKRGTAADASADGPGRPVQAFRDPFNPLSHAQLITEDVADGAARAVLRPGQQHARPEPALQADADRIRRQSETAVGQLGLAGGPGIDVTIEGDAIVLSLTDTSTFGMFAVGSAEPNGDLVKLIQAITPVVAADGGRIIIRGHTDSRPYRGDRGNNNWRLAMARAEVVYGMLARASIEEGRFERIEAHADRKPKIAADPGAAANRRIEILLRRGAP
jgi:chemotaxis protein MotB